jgi:hypothetical protein
MADELNLPWKIYFFNEDGKYEKYNVFTCKGINEFKRQSANIKEHAIIHKLEVRVCDSLDHCLMHWKDGERIFPK